MQTYFLFRADRTFGPHSIVSTSSSSHNHQLSLPLPLNTHIHTFKDNKKKWGYVTWVTIQPVKSPVYPFFHEWSSYLPSPRLLHMVNVRFLNHFTQPLRCFLFVSVSADMRDDDETRRGRAKKEEFAQTRHDLFPIPPCGESEKANERRHDNFDDHRHHHIIMMMTMVEWRRTM